MAATRLVPLLLLLLGGHVGPRLSLPPLPEDPTLARMAPEDPLWYFSWSGAREPDPKSDNQTEQILAEPEVRDFLQAVDKALTDAIRSGAPPTPQGKLLGAEGPKLIRALIAHPAAAFISKVSGGTEATEFSGGVIVRTGEETEQLKSILERLEQTILGAAKTIGDGGTAATWHKIPASADIPAIEWGFRGKYLIVAFGEESAEAIWNRRDGQPPAWLTTVKKKLAVERISTVHYINVTKAIAVVKSLIGGVEARPVFSALGLDKARQFATVSGLDRTGYVSKSWLQVDGEFAGMLARLGPEPLTAADLAPIPKDASIAVAVRTNAARHWKSMLDGVRRIDAETGDELAYYIEQLEKSGGLRIKEDFLETLGDSLCIYNSPGEGGLLITGLTVVVPVKDHDRLVKTNEQFVNRVRAANAPKPVDLPSFVVNKSTFKKQKIYSVAPTDSEIFSTAWCITDKQLIVSLSPQNIRAFLSRDPAAGSLADLPDVAERLKKNSPVLLSYEDTAAMLKITYPLLQMVATAVFKEWQQDGLDLDPGVVPSLVSLIRHVSPAISTMTCEEDGLVFVSRQSLPIDLTLSEIAAIFTFAPDSLVLPAF